MSLRLCPASPFSKYTFKAALGLPTRETEKKFVLTMASYTAAHRLAGHVQAAYFQKVLFLHWPALPIVTLHALGHLVQK